jgi:cytidyltransferase-like protein
MIGVFVARMQPLHKSHEYLIRESLKDNDKTYVFVGSADKARNKRNPFTIEERMDLIGKVFAKEIGDGKLFLISLNDLSNENDLENDKAWGQYLYDSITNTIKEDTFTIYYSDEPSIMLNWFDDDLKWKICFKFYDRAELFSTLSATKIREALLDNNIDYLKASLPDEVFMEREKLASILKTI